MALEPRLGLAMPEEAKVESRADGKGDSKAEVKVEERSAEGQTDIAKGEQKTPGVRELNGEKKEDEKGSNITVAVRIRPLSVKEKARQSWATVELIDETHVLAYDPDDKMGGLDYLRLDKTKTRHYRFDFALGPESTQVEVYERTNKPLVHKAIQGYNACCFAYGATGAGKTFTMMGNLEHAGVIPLTLIELFELIKSDEETDFKLSMQYLEIYNEKIKDLLNPSDANLDVREVPSRGTYVAGATDKTVSTPDEMMALIHEGNLYRTTEATKVNEVSSRSHAVLQVSVRAKNRYQSDAPSKLGKLSMIDLAGSERANKTDNSGQRLVEGQNINRSLLALGNCINALADKTKKAAHVPYRDSKLTRLLKDSLGGNCLTTMITNVSPSHDQFDETLNSLKYANRAKNIKPRGGLPIVVNEQRDAPLLSEIQKLQRELASLPDPADHQWQGQRHAPAQGHGHSQPMHHAHGAQSHAHGRDARDPAHGNHAAHDRRRTASVQSGASTGTTAGKRLPKHHAGRHGPSKSNTACNASTGEARNAANVNATGMYGLPPPPPLNLTPREEHDRPVPLWGPLATPHASHNEADAHYQKGRKLVGELRLDDQLRCMDDEQEHLSRQPSFLRGMRSPGLGHRNWGQTSGAVSQISAAITQPRALQMYQLLDNMEVSCMQHSPFSCASKIVCTYPTSTYACLDAGTQHYLCATPAHELPFS